MSRNIKYHVGMVLLFELLECLELNVAGVLMCKKGSWFCGQQEKVWGLFEGPVLRRQGRISEDRLLRCFLHFIHKWHDDVVGVEKEVLQFLMDLRIS